MLCSSLRSVHPECVYSPSLHPSHLHNYRSVRGVNSQKNKELLLKPPSFLELRLKRYTRYYGLIRGILSLTLRTARNQTIITKRRWMKFVAPRSAQSFFKYRNPFPTEEWGHTANIRQVCWWVVMASWHRWFCCGFFAWDFWGRMEGIRNSRYYRLFYLETSFIFLLHENRSRKQPGLLVLVDGLFHYLTLKQSASC